jgi:flagellar biosynthetic protein FliR
VTFTFDPALVTAFSLALVRAVAWLFVAPPFNTRLIPSSVKAGMAASLALVAAPQLVQEGGLPTETTPFVAALVLQVIVGVTLAMVTMFLLNALTAAGSFVDLFAGFSLAQIYDPLGGTHVSVFGRFYQLLATTLLFTTNAHLLLVNGFFRSFQAVPANGLGTGDVASMLTDNLGTFLVAALEVAGPVLGCLFLAEVTLGLLSRAAPSLNVFALAFPVRVVLALVIVGLAIPLVAPALSNLVQQAITPLGGG